MKDPGNVAEKLLDLPYAPEAEAYLDELERSGQFRIGAEAELDDDAPTAANDYPLARGSGGRVVADWWTSGAVTVRPAPGILPEHLELGRAGDSLVIGLRGAADHVTLESYLGLIPDASTLRVIFGDGGEWHGRDVLARLSASAAAAPGR